MNDRQHSKINADGLMDWVRPSACGWWVGDGRVAFLAVTRKERKKSHHLRESTNARSLTSGQWPFAEIGRCARWAYGWLAGQLSLIG